MVTRIDLGFLFLSAPSLSLSPQLHKLFEALCLYHLRVPSGSRGWAKPWDDDDDNTEILVECLQETDRLNTRVLTHLILTATHKSKLLYYYP